MDEVMPDWPPLDDDGNVDPDFDDDGEGWLLVLFPARDRDSSMDDWIS